MFITFDIGGTKMRLASSPRGKTLEQVVIHPTVPDNFEESMKTFVAAARQLSGGEPIEAIAGGIAGPLDAAKTMITTAPNLPGWNNQPLKALLEQELRAPVYLENDTAMNGLGEAIAGTGQGRRIVAYVTVSTGVGGCLIVDQRIAPSALGFEPGHQIIDPAGPLCGCGQRGHLEAFVSGTALERTYGRPAKEIKDPAVWQEAARHLAIGLTNLIMFWSPDVVVLGGPMMNDINIDEVRSHVRERISVFPTLPIITLSSLKDRAGLTGSLYYISSIRPALNI